MLDTNDKWFGVTYKEDKDYVVKSFARLIEAGVLWNGGVFAFRLGYVLKRAHELIDFKNYDDLFAKYNTLKKISFDYAVVEHEPLIEVMRFSGTWKDLGTWNTLTEAMDSNNVGEALFNILLQKRLRDLQIMLLKILLRKKERLQSVLIPVSNPMYLPK